MRQPLMLLPTAFSAATDAWNACNRLTELFQAETMDTSLTIDPDQKAAIEVVAADFEWVTAAPPPAADADDKHKKRKTPSPKPSLDANRPHLSEETFRIRNLNLRVDRGSLVAIVGPVGSGKSSLLQGLIGEMKRTAGTVSFAGKVAYCPQSAWIQNGESVVCAPHPRARACADPRRRLAPPPPATVRDNILFGQEFDKQRYWQVVEQSCLISDLEMLPAGDQTEIGEKGINLSGAPVTQPAIRPLALHANQRSSASRRPGGQRQRVNIARALYFNADVLAFDDPLSALDAHVGARVFEGAFLKLRELGKTVVLVTHALHFLPQVDKVFTLEDGHVVEEGTFDELVGRDGAFARLMHDFGGVEEETREEQEIAEEAAIEGDSDLKQPQLKRGVSVKAVEAVDERKKAEGEEGADVSGVVCFGCMSGRPLKSFRRSRFRSPGRAHQGGGPRDRRDRALGVRQLQQGRARLDPAAGDRPARDPHAGRAERRRIHARLVVERVRRPPTRCPPRSSFV